MTPSPRPSNQHRLAISRIAAMLVFSGALVGCSQESTPPAANTATPATQTQSTAKPLTSEPADRPTILVTAVTGRQGRALARQLLERGFHVRGLSRDVSKASARTLVEAGVDMVQGDFADPASVQRAAMGAQGMFLNIPSSPSEITMGANAVDAALAAGVQHLVYSTSLTTDPDNGIADTPKAAVEQHLRDSGLPYTILRPAMFMENYAGGQARIATTGLRDPRDAGSIQQFISVEDIAFFAAQALADPASWAGRELNIATDALTGTQVAALFAQVMGQPVAYTQITWEQWGATRPPRLVRVYQWYEQGALLINVTALRERYPKLRTLEQYLRASGWENWTQ